MESISTVISLTASVVSVSLALTAIWIALHGKSEADKTNQKMQDLLTEIRSDAKSIAQYAIPELRAYGDSVRKFAFRKGEESSESVLSKVEEVLANNMQRIDEEIDSIRKEKDLSAVRRKLDQLDTQLRESQESVRKSVRESQTLTVQKDEDSFVVPQSEWPNFIEYLDSNHNLKRRDYGSSWVFEYTKTNHRIPEHLIIRKVPFEELPASHGNVLKLIML